VDKKKRLPELKLMPYHEYSSIDRDVPLRFYYYPVIGKMYRRRVEYCLAECTGGDRVLEVGFGSGATFLNLNEIYQEIHGLDLNTSVNDVTAIFKAKQVKTYLKNGNVLSMPYAADFFDTVLLISILEHLKPQQLIPAFHEISRVLKPEGQIIYGVPIERRLMVFMFSLLGYNIREHHFSTEKDIFNIADSIFEEKRIIQMQSIPSFLGQVYEVGHFVKT